MHSLVSALRIPQQVIVPLATEETVLKWFSTNSSVSRKRQNGTRVTDTFVFGKAKLKKKKKKTATVKNRKYSLVPLSELYKEASKRSWEDATDR